MFYFFDSFNIETHRIVGFYEPSLFIREISKSLTNEGFSALSAKYETHRNNKAFINEYIYEVQKAGLIDSCYILDYIGVMTSEELVDSKFIKHILQYGYYKSFAYIKYNTILFNGLLKQYSMLESDNELKEPIRVRLLLSLSEFIYNSNDSFEVQKVLSIMEKLENGNDIAIFDMFDNSRSGIFITKFPSRYYILETAIKNGSEAEKIEAFQNYTSLLWRDSVALDQIVYEIDNNNYPFLSNDLALLIAKRATDLNQSDANLKFYYKALIRSQRIDEANRIKLKIGKP